MTGISGFIASALADRLLADGYQVAGLVRQSTRDNEALKRLRGKVTMYQGDLRYYWAIKKALDDFKPDYIFHLGAITPVSYSFEHPMEVTEANYMGVVNLVEAAKIAVPQLKRFIFSGSMEEYGFQPEHFKIKNRKEGEIIELAPFSEDRILKPACPYAVAKVAAEKFIQYSHFAYGFPGVIFRQTNAYGRKENDYFVVEALITKMLRNPETIDVGRKEPIRNFIHIDDLVEAWMVMMKADDKVNGEVFNTGPANGVTIYELASQIANKLNWQGKINWDTKEIRPGEILYLNSSYTKIADFTGWRPKITLDEGLDRIITFWKDKYSRMTYNNPRL